MITLEKQIKAHFSDLSPQLQQAASYVLDHQHDVATRSQRQLAKMCGLTPTTLSRLCRAIGYDQYEQLRDTCRISLKSHATSLTDRSALMHNSGTNQRKDNASAFTFQHARQSVQNIDNTLATLDTSNFELIAEELCVAHRVLLVGALSSRAMVDYLAHMASLALPNWGVVDNNGNAAAQALADVDRHCVVFAISIAPYLRSTVEFTKAASQRHAKVVAITDSVASPVLEFSNHSILAPTDSQLFFPSHVTLLVLIEGLMGAVVRQSGQATQKRVEDVEQIRHAIGDYY